MYKKKIKLSDYGGGPLFRNNDPLLVVEVEVQQPRDLTSHSIRDRTDVENFP